MPQTSTSASETTASDASSPGQGTDHLARLRKMSTTAGVGGGDYAAISPVAVGALIVALLGTLAFLYEILLLLPAVGLVLGGLGMRQIARSNGTLTGRPLALAAIVISGLLLLYLGGGRVLEYVQRRPDRIGIAQTLDGWGKELGDRNYLAAYQRMSPTFKSRVAFDLFAEKFRQLEAAAPEAGGLSGARWNEAVEFRPVPPEGAPTAEVGLMLAFRSAPEVFTVALMARVNGVWLIQELPNLFPEARPPRPRPGGAPNGAPSGAPGAPPDATQPKQPG